MRPERRQLGIEETKTPEAVKEAVANTDGTLMSSSIGCGCSAGRRCPVIAMALQNAEKPDTALRFWRGGIDATTARDYFTAPSFVAVNRYFEGGTRQMFERATSKVVILHIAQTLIDSFNAHALLQTPASN